MTEKQMLRSVLERLKETGNLTVCAVPVDPKYELGAVLTYYNNERPILFTRVKGSDLSVAGALYGNRRILYDLLKTSPEARMAKLTGAIASPVKPRLLDKGPVQEKQITHGIDLRRMYPIPTSNELDSAPFITAGMFVFKDPETGRVHMAVRRFQVNDGNSINVLVSGASPRLLQTLADHEKTKRDLQCAVVLGYDALFLLSSQISSQKYGLDKYEVDSAMRGEPLELVRCRSIDLEVPAHGEIVMEGVLRAGHSGREGPFAELMGNYSETGTAPLMEITTVTQRNSPIFQHAFPCREEHLAYGIMREVEIYAALKSVVDVRDVNLTVGGGCRLHAVVSIRKRKEGDGKSSVLTALGAYKDIKHVIVVDEDVDIYDPADVEFALTTRFQASKDLVIVSGALGSPLDASHTERDISDKLGFDATKPLGAAAKRYERAIIPGFDNNLDIKKYIN